jgi:uncharacterized membrane protein
MTVGLPTYKPTASQLPAYCMGIMLIASGAAHFIVPTKFDWMVPSELPGSQRLYTHASGIAEIATGALILAPRTRRFGGSAAAAVFVGVFPANLNGVRLWWNRPFPTRMVPILRLPLQIPLITTALKIRRNAPTKSQREGYV